MPRVRSILDFFSLFLPSRSAFVVLRTRGFSFRVLAFYCVLPLTQNVSVYCTSLQKRQHRLTILLVTVYIFFI